MAEKTKYLGYHLVFECEEGYDVPVTASEKRHHRMRHRSEAKPTFHGAHLTERRHGKAHLLARHHSWPQLSEDLDEGVCTLSCERPAPVEPQDNEEHVDDDLGPLKTDDVVSADWPPLRLGGMISFKVENSASSMYVEPSDTTSQSSLSMEPPQYSAIEAAEASPKVSTFAGRLLAAAGRGTGRPEKWSNLKKLPKLPPPPLPPPMSEGEVLLKEVGGRSVTSDVAIAASRCLQKLVKDYIDKSGDISFGQMVGMLKYAVELGDQKLQKPKGERPAEEIEVPPEVIFDQAPVNLDLNFDLRGKGWMRSHKASCSVKAHQKVGSSQKQRLAQKHNAAAPDSFQLGQSWQVNDKRRSKQHGGHLLFRRSCVGWVEE